MKRFKDLLTMPLEGDFGLKALNLKVVFHGGMWHLTTFKYDDYTTMQHENVRACKPDQWLAPYLKLKMVGEDSTGTLENLCPTCADMKNTLLHDRHHSPQPLFFDFSDIFLIREILTRKYQAGLTLGSETGPELLSILVRFQQELDVACFDIEELHAVIKKVESQHLAGTSGTVGVLGWRDAVEHLTLRMAEKLSAECWASPQLSDYQTDIFADFVGLYVNTAKRRAEAFDYMLGGRWVVVNPGEGFESSRAFFGYGKGQLIAVPLVLIDWLSEARSSLSFEDEHVVMSRPTGSLMELIEGIYNPHDADGAFSTLEAACQAAEEV